MTPWQQVPCVTCGKPAAGVFAGPGGFCDAARLVLCRAHYFLARKRAKGLRP